MLLGCRRHGETLSIEVWDTGIGIPAAELQAIFEEYHQLDNVGARTQPRPGPWAVDRAAAGDSAGSSRAGPFAPRQGFGVRHRGQARCERCRTRAPEEIRSAPADGWRAARPSERQDPGRRGRSRSARSSGTFPDGRGPSRGRRRPMVRRRWTWSRMAPSSRIWSWPTTICRTA